MNARILFSLALCAVALPAVASEHRSGWRSHPHAAVSNYDRAAAPQLLVQVQRITALDPSGRTVTLYEQAKGPFLPIDRLGGIAPGLELERMPERGAYTKVTAELGQEVWVVDGGRFMPSTVGAGIRIPLTGAVIRDEHQAVAYGLDMYQPAATRLARDDRSHNSDEEDRDDD